MYREKIQREIDALGKSIKVKKRLELFLNFLAVSMFILFIWILATGGYNGKRIGYAMMSNLDELEARQVKVNEGFQEQIRKLQERVSKLEGPPPGLLENP